jgi:hypothetical protein
MKKYADDHKLEYIDFYNADKFYKTNKLNITCFDPVDYDVLNNLWDKSSAKGIKFSVSLVA